MLNPFNILEKILYLIRDTIWRYPDLILLPNPIKSKIIRSYELSIPYSHFIASFVICLLIISILFSFVQLPIYGREGNSIIEGVIMGVDDFNRPQKLSKINPLLSTNVQLEKDISELIYEPLIRYEFVENESGVFKTQVRDQLAERITLIQQGADYLFELKRGVKWHDGRQFNVDDVIATFALLSILPEDNSSVRTIKQLNWQKVDEYSIRICTRNDSQDASNCDSVRDKRKISNLLELLSFKILPAHRIVDINQSNFATNLPEIYRAPVGTGKFKFVGSDDFTISLARNTDYYIRGSKGQINNITFKYYRTLEDGIRAIQNGEVHTLTSNSAQYLREIDNYKNINTNLSPVISQQYWGLYFNLLKNPDGNLKGPAFLSDVKVRQAISSAINRSEIIGSALLGLGEEAFGPIQNKSEFFSENAKWYRYDLVKARALLDEAGWTLKPGSKYRSDASGNEMKFSLYFVDSFDRNAIARVIRQNLESVGVNVIINRSEQQGQSYLSSKDQGWSLSELTNEILAPRAFDVILYGINTFVDPDRYELFHSSQSAFPGLNLSSYTGSALTFKTNPNRQSVNDPSTISSPKVDELLERGRARDPVVESDERLADYKEVQDLIAQDAPVVFLYNPKFVYYSNSVIKNIDLKNVSSTEDRFRNIDEWRI